MRFPSFFYISYLLCVPALTTPHRSNSNNIQPITAFYIFLSAGIFSAVYAPIQDCDETYNYWEPAHYLVHGYGRQTWEYSPDYSIRSWFYIGLHAVLASLRRILPQASKVGEFYFVRYVLAIFCALCQTILFQVISGTIHPRIGFFFIIALFTSPGNFHASTAFLPSSFAMYAVMLGAAAFMNWRGGLKTLKGMFWFAVAGVIGWPFAAALCAPFLLEEGVLALSGGGSALFDGFIRVARGVVAALVLVAVDTAVNTFFYKKVAVVAWNIVKYNIFSAAENGGGPNLYGTEPWTFYFKNLALNFNIWFVLALAALPLFLLQKIAGTSKKGLVSGMRAVVFLTPFYMWLAIFTLQPHKEERFMYPAYPFLALNAAFALHIVLEGIGHSTPGTLAGLIPGKVKLLAVLGVFTSCLAVSGLRIYGVISGYGAPLSVYKPLGGNVQHHDVAAGIADGSIVGNTGDFVCLGKEWYRFPNSFFLPRDMHVKFVRSEFRGLLPGEFSEARTGFGLWSGTWLPTSGMNDRNEEDMGKYTDLNTCAFMVDTQYPENARLGRALPPHEPDYVADTANWEIVQCEPFLDAGNTGFLARALWVPDLDFLPGKYQRKWARHCLLKRREEKQI